MTRRALYIAGPMRGYPEHNVPAFNAAADRFRAAAWHVINPVDLSAEIDAQAAQRGGSTEPTGGDYLREDLAWIIGMCGAIALLPGWEASTGARCEVAVGITLGLEFYDAETMAPIPTPHRVTVCGGYECAPGAVDSLDGLAQEVRAWQRVTFPRATPHSVATHLLKEARELHREPGDAEEIADLFMLVVGAAGASGVDLAAAVRRKLEENKGRTWGEPDADGVVEHVRDIEPTDDEARDAATLRAAAAVLRRALFSDADGDLGEVDAAVPILLDGLAAQLEVRA